MKPQTWPDGRWLPWPVLMQRARERIRAGYTMRPPAEFPCRIVLTLARNGNGLLNVRCECMAGTVNKPKSRFYNYDVLGRRLTLAEARELWEAHRLIKGEDDARRNAVRDTGQ